MLSIIQTYNWGYLYNYACIVLTMSVREFNTHLEVVQDKNSGIVLQSIVEGHVLQIDPQVISKVIGVPVLHIFASPFNEAVEAPTLEDFREFFNAIPQEEERATNIRIRAFSPPHRRLAKIVKHNLWPTIFVGVI
jgi:hypothetical protein